MAPLLSESDFKEALAAVRHAQDTRMYHRLRTRKGSKQRETDLQNARERLRKAMLPLRSFLGAAPKLEGAEEAVARAKQASEAIQTERRKLWKMQQMTKR